MGLSPMIRMCFGNHGRQGMAGCLDPRVIEGKWVCGAPYIDEQIVATANLLIDESQAVLNACWDDEELFKGRGE